MWSFQSKPNALHEQLLQAPETDPSEFVRRYLSQHRTPVSQPSERLTDRRNPLRLASLITAKRKGDASLLVG